jgi:high-affinity iron transporter
MKHPVWSFFLHLALFCSFAMNNAHAAQANEAEVRQLWQLLDYVAVDYAGAVQNGKVVSELE